MLSVLVGKFVLSAMAAPGCNLIELGPRETGKPTFRDTSSRGFVVSGGKATPATLFYNKASRKLGVVGLKQSRLLRRDCYHELRRRGSQHQRAEGLYADG
jgi:predicted ATP-dependent Lon-type protease